MYRNTMMDEQSSAGRRGGDTALVIILIVAWAAALIALPWAPERIVTHWDIAGRPNGWMPRLAGLLLLPAITTLIVVLLRALPRVDPLRRNYAAFAGAYRLLQVAIA